MDVKNHYSIEPDKILNYLTDLENSRIYELTGTLGTASCVTLAKFATTCPQSAVN